MVHFKVTDGSQTRRLEAPSRLTYEGLKKKLSSLFPDSVKKNSDLVLQYRDADGDMITLSSDQELQELLSINQDEGLKFYLPKASSSRICQRKMGRYSPYSLWNSSRNFSAVDRIEKEIQEFEELMDTLANPRKSPSSTDSSSKKNECAQPSEEFGAKTTEVDGSSKSETGDGKKFQTISGNKDSDEPIPATLEDGSKKDPPKTTSTQRHLICRGLAPLLLSDSLFYPPAPRSTGFHITWSPCGGLQCVC